MLRKIIEIDEQKCVGCGLCASACHEGAIKMVNGKAKLIREDYCDGLGDCLPACPVDAIKIIEREATAYNEKAVEQNKKKKEKSLGCGCPGSAQKSFERKSQPIANEFTQSRLSQWPVQIKLINENAQFLDGADLLIAADCAAYAYGNFHNDFIKNKVCIIGCPKLDEGDYTDKLFAIINNNNIKSVSVVRMEVPCCSGIENATKNALQKSGKFIPWQVVTLSTDGRILD